MKNLYTLSLLAALLCARPAVAQETSSRRPASRPAPASDYATDIDTVGQSQQDALDQAKKMMEDTETPTARAALQTAIKEMEAAEKSLQAAKKNPADLPAAETAEQAAYQALLKMVPHEYRVTRSQRGQRQQGGRAGQPGQQQMEQLEMTSEQNRYETERQAAAPQTQAQKEQVEAADRLKQLAQRQQDLNDRLRELQTALQAARTEKEQEEIKRELKHLADEERQMLTDVDDLQQKLDQASNASSLSQTARDLDQTRAETQKAAQEMANQSVSQALASGTRAQQGMQNARENLRSQTSSQFSSQMRQLQNQARDLAKKEEDIGRDLQAMDGGNQKTLDNEKQRQQLAQQMKQQEGGLSNLLANMQEVTEKAETTEPLLYEQLYDTLRRASQMHTESLLDTGSQLVDRGFLAKGAEVELGARTNINELRQRVEHAAESVLGSQSDALRFAQSELKDLTKQVESGLGNRGTNSAASSGRGTNSSELSEALTNSSSRSGAGTNSMASRQQGGRNGQQANRNAQQTGQDGQQAGQGGQQGGRNGQQGGRNGQQGGQQTSQDGQQAGQDGQQAGQGGQQGGRNGQQAGRNGQQAGRGGQQGDRNGQQNNGGGGAAGRLRELVQQSGGPGDGGMSVEGPIAGGGNDFVNWADRMRDVETVVDSVTLRNRLATVRERVASYRADYRRNGRIPPSEVVKEQVVQPMMDIRAEIEEDLARLENARSLVPLDHDPVPDHYTELVRKYYEKLGGGQ
jgi:hypothetical protein